VVGEQGTQGGDTGGDAPAPSAGVLSESDIADVAQQKQKKTDAAAANAAARDDKAREKFEKAKQAEKERIAKAEKEAARVGVAVATDGTDTTETTEYARQRPRRENAGKTSLTVAGFRDADGGTLQLHPLRSFAKNTKPGSNVPGCQPFRLVVTPSAQLVMDTHAHLCTNEVIGYLGGTWDLATRTVTCVEAFPGRGVASGSDVEMDPVAEVELKAQVEQEGLRVVGWYHSHPVFEPTPSGVDVDNQLNYQNLFVDNSKDANAKPEKPISPFVGFIVGPYDLRLPTRVSKMTAFVAERLVDRTGSFEDVPYEARYEVSTEAPDEKTLDAIKNVVVAHKDVPGRVLINELWRHFTNIKDNTPDGGPVTKLAKLRASLTARLPDTIDELAAETMLDEVAKHLQTVWEVDLGY
jgi:protein MYSM1